eukprot:4917452-Amphidinium_carterae.1
MGTAERHLSTITYYEVPILQGLQHRQPQHQLTQLITQPHTARHPTRETGNDNTHSPYDSLEQVYIDNLMTENMELYQPNSQQNHDEASWIGRETTTGQHTHTTVSPELGKLYRTVPRLPQDQHFDRDVMLKTMELQMSEKANKRTDKAMEQIPPQ